MNTQNNSLTINLFEEDDKDLDDH